MEVGGKPLNGENTHPLSVHGVEALRKLSQHPAPAQVFNPGLQNRLERGGFVRIIQRPSPYKTHKGANIPYFEITQEGREELERSNTAMIKSAQTAGSSS